ncbi:MAG: peptide-N4-asparagine amidase [Actinomycetota bacterium]
MKLRALLVVSLLAIGVAPLRSFAEVSNVVVINGAKIDQGAPGYTSSTVTIPQGSWSSVTVNFSDVPVCDPWDRLFTVDVDGVEILRGTTPRTAFSVHADVTQFSQLLAGTHTYTAHLENYWEQQYSDCGNSASGQWHQVTVSFDFTNGAAPAGLPSAFPVGWHRDILQNPGGDPGCAATNPDGIDSTKTIQIPSGTFTHAAFYGFVTSHNCEEQWFLNPTPNGPTATSGPVPNTCSPDMLVACAQRHTHLLIDGTEVGSWNPFPYSYAFVGFVGGETPGSGPLPGTTQHQFMWWTAQKTLNENGIYPGVGVIPPYVLDLTSALSKLTAGDHSIEIKIDGGDSYWVTSGELLLS